ncbi:Cobyric acid synthase [Pleomorphomonas sp. T1.2MG-36]|uniref:cobyric acid synthase n=1 Tax=Pleomorphomonas sp. T1.2MG-36 TaxID=3041167 RepID=UPI0024776E23|nr:cobyric acid synthase [Pleomorphomonas sp. T1.2MG-36]CAI9412388.1 Cobyric acid synthase [Pleomorphomonas sp. T1.2MG-36]
MVSRLMLQGTGSDVGKSLIVAGLCRLYARHGLKVRPFKPQNMSNNAAVTVDGGEIGRAQALQARAAGIMPSVHMNPILLKPQSEIGSQVVVQGRVVGNARARDYQGMKPELMPAVLDSFARLSADADLVLVEGAGSPAEINLRAGDIANMGFARATDTPVVLIGDIDRGGVIASLVGTKAVMAEEDAALVAGYLINRFRGDVSLFDAGLAAITERTGWHSFGVIPHFADAGRLPAEDALGLKSRYEAERAEGRKRIVVPVLPRIANFDDLDPLRQEPGVEVILAQAGRPLPPAELILLPGSKATIPDLVALKAEGWDVDIRAHARQGGKVLGLCGGYQMLGRLLRDPERVESDIEAIEGLGLLDVETSLTGDKRLRAVSGLSMPDATPFSGYEMHVGATVGPDRSRPFARLSDGSDEGATSRDGKVAGSYCHGLFADDRQRNRLLGWIGADSSSLAYEAEIDRVLDGLADHLAAHLDIDGLLDLSRRRG